MLKPITDNAELYPATLRSIASANQKTQKLYLALKEYLSSLGNDINSYPLNYAKKQRESNGNIFYKANPYHAFSRDSHYRKEASIICKIRFFASKNIFYIYVNLNPKTDKELIAEFPLKKILQETSATSSHKFEITLKIIKNLEAIKPLLQRAYQNSSS